MADMDKLLRFFAVSALAIAMASCATIPEDEPSAYGAFLAARYAGVNRDADGAASYYAEALEREPENSMLTSRAFVTALLAGEMERAAELARTGEDVTEAGPLVSLYLATDLISRRRFDDAVDLIQAGNLDPEHSMFSGMMLHWAMVGLGDHEGALAAAEAMQATVGQSPFLVQHRARLYEATGDIRQARLNYPAAVFSAPNRRMVTEDFGSFLERQGDSEAAIALYEALLVETPGDAVIEAALDRVRSGRRPPRMPTTSQFAARSGFGPVMEEIASGTSDLSVLYLRMLQRLDPDEASVRIQLGENLQRIGLPEAALREYEAVRPGPYFLPAAVDRIWLIGRLDRIPEATGLARDLVADTGNLEARLILADLLRVQSECGEAADLYARVITDKAAQGDAPDWRYHYFRAACLDSIGRWEDAEPEFLEAIRLAPGEGEPLNYLGYVWVDRGERIEEGFALIERAAELEPGRGHIIDSLGWAHYRVGNFAEAVTALERSVELDPGNATANFHLGDAYWQVGRFLEAGFQWRRSLDLDPDPEERIELENRLAHGMPQPSDIHIAEAVEAGAMTEQ
jgi:tetratricopeptide (TPR) repeat protein